MTYKIRFLTSKTSLPAQLIAYEQGLIPNHKLVDFFQALILSGYIEKLSGEYKDICIVLIRNKICFLPHAINENNLPEISNEIAQII